MAKAKGDDVTFSRAELLKALNTVKPAVASRSAKLVNEIYADFCFTRSHVFAHNGIIAIEAPCRSDIAGAVKAEVMLGMLANAAAKDVTLAVADNVLTIKIVRSRIKLPLRSEDLVNDAFRMPSLDKVYRLAIEDRTLFARALTTVLISAVSEAGKGAELANVMLCPDGADTYLYATDRRTFGQWALPLEITRWPKVEQTAGGVILPVSFCEQMAALLKSKDHAKDDAHLCFMQKAAILQIGDVTLLGRALYPADPYDYQTRLVAAQHAGARSQPWIITPAFRHAIGRAAVVLKGMAKVTGTLITGKGKQLHLLTIGDAGRVEDVIATGDVEQDGEVYIEPELIERVFDVSDELQMELLPTSLAIREPKGYLYIIGGISGSRPNAATDTSPDGDGNGHSEEHDRDQGERPVRRRAPRE